MKKPDLGLWARRIGFYVLGLFIMTLGISISIKSDLGVSPVSSLPLVLGTVSGVEVGTMTAMVLCFYVLLQLPLGVNMLTDGKKHKVSLRDLGLTSEGSEKMDWSLVGKALLLATVVTIIGWTYLAILADTTGTELYCIIFSMKEIPLIKLHYYIPYIIVWMLCFVVTSVSLNVERRLPTTGNEALDTAIAMVVNAFFNFIVIMAVILIQNYFQVRTGGTGEYIFQNWGMEIYRLWGMPVGMAIAGAGQTYMYRKTGNIWPGVFLMGILCALACVLYGGYNCYF